METVAPRLPVIVTHNMPQPGRASDHTAFFYLGRLVKFGVDQKDFLKSKRKANGGLYYQTLRLIGEG
jgi:ABC-type phosphate transport system ATPase subunit